MLVVAASTSDCTSVFQLPIHCAVAPAATLSICAASAGRVCRQASAVDAAEEWGFTQSWAPARTFAPVVVVDVEAGFPIEGDRGLFASPEHPASTTARHVAKARDGMVMLKKRGGANRPTCRSLRARGASGSWHEVHAVTGLNNVTDVTST